MLKRIQSLPRSQRIVVFVLFLVGVVLALAALTAGLILITFNTGGRTQGVGLVDGVRVREFAILPDDDAYPASIAAGPDGTIYTGSYVSGAIWAIGPDGSVAEIPNTRMRLGAVAGLTIAPDNSLLVVDQIDFNPTVLGGDIKRVTPDGEISVFAEGDPESGFLLPDDITVDAQGNVYVTDRGREEVWRFGLDGSGAAWWRPPADAAGSRQALTGLAYDPVQDAIIVVESNNDRIYRVSISSGQTETLYAHGNRDFAPGFDGVTVTPDGRLYIAAVAQNGIATLTASGELEYIAGAFRGPNDVVYHAGRLYVANFDSFSLVVHLIQPRLPFSIDEIHLP